MRPCRPEDEEAVIDLWRRCNLVVPQNDPGRDIRRKLARDPQWFLVAEVDGRIVGTCMAGYEGHRGWINYLAVLPEYQRRGIGTALMGEAEKQLAAAGCPKINLQIREGNHQVVQFYRSVGYSRDPVLSLGKRLVHDEPGF